MLALDTRRGRYRRLLVRPDGRLAGAILLGDLRDAKKLRELLRNGEAVPEELLDAGAPEPGEAVSAADGDPAEAICSCQAVTRGTIVHAIKDRGLTTVAQVAEHTRASTGCGGCRADVTAILTALREPAGAPA